MRGSKGRTRRGRSLPARGFAVVVVAPRHLVVLAWIAAAVAATLELPQLGHAGGAPLDDLVAKDSESGRAADRATERFGFPLVTDTAVVQHRGRGLPARDRERQLGAAREVLEGTSFAPRHLRGAFPLSNSTTAVTYLLFDPELGVQSRTELAQRYAREKLGGAGGSVVGVTGTAPARLAQFDEVERSLPLIEGASVAVVFMIVALAFRSILAPLVTLFAGVIAYLVMVRVLPWAGERFGVVVPGEVEPVLVVLLLGLVTDYSIFFLSGMRRALREGEPRPTAARTAVAGTAPLVFTAGLIVTAGTGALLAGELGFFRAFGPGLALTALVSMLVAATLVPALLAIFGERLFGRSLEAQAAAGSAEAPSDGSAGDQVRRRLSVDEPAPDDARRGRRRLRLTRPLLAIRRARGLGRAAQTSRWRALIARVASARLVAAPIAILTVAGLIAAASGLRSTELGLTFIRALPDDTEVARAADAASEGFTPGILAPTEVDLAQPGIGERRAELARLESLIEREPNVAAVVGPREQPPPPAAQAMISADGGGARYAVVLDEDPLGAPAIDSVRALRERMPTLLRRSSLGQGARISFAGETPLADETVESVLDDLKRIGVASLVVNLVLLVFFLRALVAPLYLLAASVLGLAASLGLTTLFFHGLLGQDELTYYVPFAAAVLLVALGSDYNVFVVGRIWEEARWRRLREAISVATPSAAKAISVAGVALAASFALLAIVPLGSFREFAFVMSVGVLIDTFVVRSLLVPALTSLIGEHSWWPGRRFAPVSSKAFTERVGERAGIEPRAAERASTAALSTLGERITPRERRELARGLPDRLGDRLLAADSAPERFPLDEFLSRMRRRENGGADGDVREHASAVLATLEEAVPGDLDYVRVQLSEDYDELWDASNASASSKSTRR
jgi:putative drug exporter of the RND superfamily